MSSSLIWSLKLLDTGIGIPEYEPDFNLRALYAAIRSGRYMHLADRIGIVYN